MAEFVEVSLDVRERNSMDFTLDIRTKSHTVPIKPTQTCGAFSERVTSWRFRCWMYEKEIGWFLCSINVRTNSRALREINLRAMPYE